MVSRQRLHQLKNRANGLCMACTRPLASKNYCEYHQKYHSKLASERNKKSKEDKICRICTTSLKSPVYKWGLCKKHVEQQQQYQRNYNHKHKGETKMSNREIKLEGDDMKGYANIIHMLSRIKQCEERLAILEEKNQNVKIKKTTPIKELTQIPNYLPLVNKILEDGKIWAVHALMEEITVVFPDLPAPKFTSLANACNAAANKGLLTKIAYNIYRKK